MEEASGRQTPASSANGGSKPATPVPPSSPAPSVSSQQSPAASSSAPSGTATAPGSITTAAIHGGGRYGYPTPPPPPPPQQQPHVGPYGPPPPGGVGQPGTGSGHHPGYPPGPYGGGGGGPPGPHQMMGGPPPGPHHHHHGQYMSPMMMPPPSQYPNKPGQPGPPPPQQHVPFMAGGSDGRSAPAGPYGNYQGGPRMPPQHHQQHPGGPPPPPQGPPSHHGNAGPTPPSYYGMPRHQMHPQQHPPPQSMSGKNAFAAYANQAGYPGQGPMGVAQQQQPPPNSSPSPHGMPPGHPGHHGGPPPPHHPHHPGAGGPPPPPPHPNNPMMVHHHAQHPHPHGYGGYGSHGTSDAHHVNANSSSPMVNSNSNNGSSGPSAAGAAATAASHNSNGNVRLPQPPTIMDEVSQTSTASSQAADDSCASSDMPSHKHTPSSKHHLSHPNTPNASNLGSPGAASLSSFHDEFDSVSSPSWPRTPASPALNSSQYDSHVHNSKRPDNVQKLYEMSEEPERKLFLDKYFLFLDERGTPLNQVPTISKIPVDLYRLYVLVKERGGYLEVTRTKMWKDCAQLCNIANSSSASYTLRKQYMKHLLPYECKFDRGGIDVGPLLSAADAASATRKKTTNSKLQANSGRSTPNTTRLSPNDSPAAAPYHHPHHPGLHPAYEMEQQQPNSYSNSAGPNQNVPPTGPYHQPPPPGPYSHPDYHNSQYGQQPSSREPHNVPNNVAGTNHESVSVKDPFADEDQVQSSPRVSKSTASTNYHQSRSHYSAMPNHTGPYPYGQPGAPPPPPGAPNSQPPPPGGQPHSNSYPPESGVPPGHYGHADGGQYHPQQRHPPGPTTEGPTSGNNPYGSRMGLNGPSSHHHGYYGSYQQQQQQQNAYPEHPSSAGPPPPPPGQHGRAGPYEHHGPHGGYPPPPPGHRYPMPNNVGPGQHPPSGAGQVPPNNYGPPPPSNRGGYPPPGGAVVPPPHHGPPPPASTSPHHGHGHSNQIGAGPPPSPSVSVPSSQPPPTSTHHQQAPPAGAGGYPPHNATGPQTQDAGGYGRKTPEPYNQNTNVRMQSPLAQRLLAAKLSQNSNSTTTTQSTTQSPQPSPQQGYPGPQYPPPGNTTGGGPGANAPNASNSRSSPSPAPSSTPGKPPHSSSGSTMPSTPNISWMGSNSSAVQNHQQHHGHSPHHNNIRYAQPKRHPDFMKPNAPPPDSYHTNSYPPLQHHAPQPTPYGPPNVPPTVTGPRGSIPASNSPAAAANAPGWGAAAGSNRSDSQYRMPGYYHHPSYQNSGPPPSPAQRDSWHESRGTPSVVAPPPSTASTTAEAPPTAMAHWPSNRYSSGYSEYGNAQSGHYAGHHPNAGSKMIPNAAAAPVSQYVRPDVTTNSSRSNFMSGPPMSHSHSGGYPPNKMPPIPMSGGASHSISYGPFGMQGLHSMHHHPQAAPGTMSSVHPSSMRRDPLFPPNSVEATVPTLTKRRKLLARDVAPVEAWRLFMSLKSGLLAESTYALDVLNVYSNDDNSLIYLSLANMPGLLEVLLEHYRRYLNEMFDNMFEDIEIGYEDKQSLVEKKRKKRPLKWYEIDRDLDDQNEQNLDEDDDDIEEFLDRKFNLTGKRKLTLFDSTNNNFTSVTRNGKPVKVKKDKNLFILDYDKKWDPSKNGFSSGYEHWAKGGGETTTHIQSHMEPKERYIRFCRLIKSKKARHSIEENDDHGNGADENHSEKTEQPVVKMNGECSPQLNGNHITEEADYNEDGDSCKKFLNNENDYPKIHPTDRERYWKRLHQPDFEDESYDQEEPAVSTGREYQDSIKSRCLAVSNLIRNLTFVPQNDLEMSRSPCLLLILSRLVLLHHVHAVKKKRKVTDLDQAKISATTVDGGDEAMLASLIDEKSNDATDTNTSGCSVAASAKHPEPEKEWWWEALHLIRENTMVTLANISGHLDLSTFTESITLSLLDGLLHWAVCPSSYAQDAFPAAPVTLSPRRLAYEALSKLSIYECNVDLILATPPWSRIEKFLRNLTKSLVRNEDQTIREFSIVLISNLVTADPSVVRVIANSGFALSLLLGFIEQAEQSALNVANTQGIHYLRENFDAIGTTMDMVRRAAAILRTLARHHENRSQFIQHEQRLLSLSMSQILDTPISSIIADILYECSFESSSSSSKQQATAAAATSTSAVSANQQQNSTANNNLKQNEESNNSKSSSTSPVEQPPAQPTLPAASNKTVAVES